MAFTCHNVNLFFTAHCRNFDLSQEKIYAKIHSKITEYIPLLELLSAHLYHNDAEKYLWLKRNGCLIRGVSKYFDHGTSLFRVYLLTSEASPRMHAEGLHIKWHDHSHLYNRSKSSQSQHKVSLSQKMCLTSHSTQGLCLLVYTFKIKGIFRVLSYHPNSAYSDSGQGFSHKVLPILGPLSPTGIPLFSDPPCTGCPHGTVASGVVSKKQELYRIKMSYI